MNGGLLNGSYVLLDSLGCLIEIMVAFVEGNNANIFLFAFGYLRGRITRNENPSCQGYYREKDGEGSGDIEEPTE